MNVFFYDGNCPFCSKLAEHLKSRCTREDIQFLSFRNMSEAEIKKIHKDLNFDLLAGNTQFILDKRRYPHFFR